MLQQRSCCTLYDKGLGPATGPHAYTHYEAGVEKSQSGVPRDAALIPKNVGFRDINKM